MTKIILFFTCFFLFMGVTKLICQSQSFDSSSNPKDFYYYFKKWDNNRFEAYNNKVLNAKDKLIDDSLNKNIYDSSWHQQLYFNYSIYDEIGRIGKIKFGKRLLHFMKDEKYDFHACSLLYAIFGPYPYGPQYMDFRHKTRSEWIASGQKEKDYNFWFDQFYGEDDFLITQH